MNISLWEISDGHKAFLHFPGKGQRSLHPGNQTLPLWKQDELPGTSQQLESELGFEELTRAGRVLPEIVKQKNQV